MKSSNPWQVNLQLLSGLVGIGCLIGSGLAIAQEVPHLNITQPGGMPGWPIITGIAPGSNQVTVTWDGPPGYYQLLGKLGLTDPTWRPVGPPNFNRIAKVPTTNSSTFFRVSGAPPSFAGSQACAECHEGIHQNEMNTRHSHALDTLKRINQHQNPACLPCHTVGYGLPTGFISESATPHLAGVQCENCHGAAAKHAANDFDLSVRPRAELAAQVCGGCHTTSHHPTYDEWSTTKHALVTEDMNPSGRINSCGRCHSGSSRLALINGENPAITVAGDANMPITCVVCHDPHANHVWTNVLTGTVTTNQLRNPVASTNDYFLATTDVFTNKYDPNINICAQCHNHRGASWSSSSRPPHYSPQYNMLLGTVGELVNPAGRRMATHATAIEKQCVGCHMPTEEFGGEAHPALTGHKFEVEKFDSCLSCHPLPEALTDFTQQVVETRIHQIQGFLNQWALTKAVEPIQKYGALAWEYDFAGHLSSPDGSLRGPVSSTNPNLDEQKYIPTNIKKARFNLYLVYQDGSYGVHNPLYTITLLDTAQQWVLQELNP